jgi:Pectinacetylesterase
MKRTILVLLVASCGTTANVPDAGGVADATADVTPSSDAMDAPSNVDAGTPIMGLTPGMWSWVPFPGALCRDGTSTGIGISPSPTGSDKLMIFLEGGGACFNASTCGANPLHFDETTFATQFLGVEQYAGIMSRMDMQSAVAQWNMVYVPYCTGDVHSGAAPNAMVSGIPGTQQFVGYLNIVMYMQRLVPTFPSVSRVLLTGHSAGGFGAAINYVQVSRAFGSVPVDLLDDAGPLMGNPYLAACLEQQMTSLWGLSSTFIAQDCGSDCNDPGNDLLLYWKHLPRTYPTNFFGFIDSTGDSVIASFFGFGANNCTSYAAVSAAQYEAGLLDMRSEVASDPNAGLFIYDGVDHTTLLTAYTTRSAPASDGGTVLFEDWVSALVSGNISNVGP